MKDLIETTLIGKYVICRCTGAGVHAGILKSLEGETATLEKSRRLFFWKVANKGAFLSGVAAEGLEESSKLGCPIDIYLTGVCEVIPCTPESEKSIVDMESHEGE